VTGKFLPGQKVNFRVCPGRFGTLGNYETDITLPSNWEQLHIPHYQVTYTTYLAYTYIYIISCVINQSGCQDSGIYSGG